MRKLPVLSCWRPWPTLILHYNKTVENRVWATSYRGDLLLAGSVRWDNKMQWPVDRPATLSRPLSRWPADHPRGIVGVVELYGMCTATVDGGTCDCGSWAAPGQVHWQLRNPRPFDTPVPHQGRQKLHQVPDGSWPAVAAQLDQVAACEPVDRIARDAVRERLGRVTGDELRVQHDGAFLRVWTNSGGNSFAVDQALTAAGYQVSMADEQSHKGVVMIVGGGFQ